MKPFSALLMAAALSACLVSPAGAQRTPGLSARAAMDLVAQRFGPDRAEWIVEMRGFDGIPEPEDWQIITWDPAAPHLIRSYWAGGGRATDEGPSAEYFPERSTFGYFRVAELTLDSKAAFTIAEDEARRARMGFDRLNYFLRCREFSREPVWTMELVDEVNRVVGKVYVSGSTGEVLRTVWVYHGPGGAPGGGPMIVDSAAPRESGGPTSQLRPSPPEGEIDPATGLRRFEGGQPDPRGPSSVPQRQGPPMTAPSAGPGVPPPPAPGTPGPGTDPRIPPAPGGNIDTRIPPPPLPPAP